MTAIRMPDLRARHSRPRGARAVRLPDLRVPDIVRDVSRADDDDIDERLPELDLERSVRP